MSIYREALRQRIRFNSSRGVLSTEDLFDLPLTGDFSLNAVGMNIKRKLSLVTVDSLVDTDTAGQKESDQLTLALDVIKDIIALRKEENAARLARAANRKRLNDLHEAKRKRTEESLSSMDEAAIDAEIADLSGKV